MNHSHRLLTQCPTGKTNSISPTENVSVPSAATLSVSDPNPVNGDEYVIVPKASIDVVVHKEVRELVTSNSGHNTVVREIN